MTEVTTNSFNTIQPGTTRLGWIGTGVMGRSMCAHLIKAGYSMAVYNRTEAKTQPLADLGAVVCHSPAEVAKQSDVVFSMVGFPTDVRETILGESGVLAGLRAGGVLVDMTTSQPGLAREIAERANSVGVHAIDAPVSGGDLGAREARLSIMVGGEKAVFELLMPLWTIMGKTYVYHGPAGSGQHAKMVNQILIAAGMVGLCEAMLYAQQSGLDPDFVLQSVSAGAAGSWSLTNLTPRMLKGDFEPGFFVDHIVKDLGIALAEAERLQLKLPGLELANRLYTQLQEFGHGRKGTQALVLAIAKLNGIDWKTNA